MNPISLAIHGKGLRRAIQRGFSLIRRYGFSTRKMDKALDQFTNILHQFDCGATFPITTTSLQRHPKIVQKYQRQGIEFAVHGYRHWDYSELPYDEQREHLTQARAIFREADIHTKGFRGPYLRWNGDTLTVLREDGLIYDGSPSLFWDVVREYDTAAYQHVLQFYGALSATNYPSLPILEDNLVRIPYSLPDDEALVERLSLSTEQMNEVWLAILHRTHRLGELFTIGLHPERISFCQAPLEAVLAAASKLEPAVWVARLDEIASWWRARFNTKIEIHDAAENEYQLTVNGPDGLTILARGVLIDGPTVPWSSSYQEVKTNQFVISAAKRPFIGLAYGASEKLADFLREQGYIIEYSEKREQYAYYFDQPQFVARHKRFLLAQIEGADFPLVRLSRWPNSARSAVSVTGDIDALSIRDYFMRLFGK